jgi:hypothetical protein
MSLVYSTVYPAITQPRTQHHNSYLTVRVRHIHSTTQSNIIISSRTTFQYIQLQHNSIHIISLHIILTTLYDGGMVSNVVATSFSHGSFALPKISALGSKVLIPSVNKPVRSTIVSGPMTSWWWYTWLVQFLQK